MQINARECGAAGKIRPRIGQKGAADHIEREFPAADGTKRRYSKIFVPFFENSGCKTSENAVERASPINAAGTAVDILPDLCYNPQSAARSSRAEPKRSGTG